MNAVGLLVVIASVVSSNEGSAVLDQGRLDGLQPGDTGAVFYEIKAGGETRRIEAGEATVVALGPSSATVEPLAGARLGDGHRVEFRLSPDRLLWHRILAASPDAERQALAEALIDRHLGRNPSAAARVTAALGEASVEGVTIAAGRYPIGLAFERAERYDQQPTFEIELGAFAIDSEIQPRALGLTYPQAAAFCAGRDGRLPTEFEWETASHHTGFDSSAGVYEWTSSIYLPYPGNEHRETAFEEKHRVLRGDLEADEMTPYRRRFLQPTVAHDKVAARCARDLD